MIDVAVGLIGGSLAALFQWYFYRQQKINAQTRPMTGEELQDLRVQIADASFGYRQKGMRERLRTQEDWRYAAKMERLALVLWLVGFGAAVTLLVLSFI